MSDVDTERTVVKTYVPAYQREEWDDHADRLEMSRSEFVRSMVQAGRRGFEPTTGSTTEQKGSTGRADRESLETRVVTMLSEEPRDWEELLSELTGDIEDRLDDTLQKLQEADRVRYSGRDGGYVLE